MILAIVSATLGAKTNIAMKLKNAAHSTAHWGRSTRVETIVAIEFAASWKPLMTSKANATPTVKMTRIQTKSISQMRVKGRPAPESGVLEDDALENVGHRLTAIGGALEVLVDVLPLDDRYRVSGVIEEPGNGLAKEAIALVLEAMDLDAPLLDRASVLHVAQASDPMLDLLHGLEEGFREATSLRREPV